jgi:hypothetical protein
MAGRQTPHEPFQGETWSDETGTAYELAHEGVKVRARFNEDGTVRLTILDAPPLALHRAMLGKSVENGWATIELKPTP